MKFMVAWKEFDKGLNRDVEWHSYFEKKSDAIKFMEKLMDDRYKGIKLQLI